MVVPRLVKEEARERHIDFCLLNIVVHYIIMCELLVETYYTY